MSEQTQTRLGAENSILSYTKVRRLAPDDLGTTAPDTPSEQLTDSDLGEKLRSAPVEAVEASGKGVLTGGAVVTADESLYTGIPVDGEGWGVHAVELAVSKAVSDGAEAITDVAVYSKNGSGLCGRCLQAIADNRAEGAVVQMIDADDDSQTFEFGELYPAPWQS